MITIQCPQCKKDFDTYPYRLKRSKNVCCSVECMAKSYKEKPAWNKGIPDEKHRDCNHPNWKGPSVSYGALHSWISRKLGKPDKCEHCLKDGLKSYRIQWANKSGEYKRELADWIRLCVPCHRKHDNQIKSTL